MINFDGPIDTCSVHIASEFGIKPLNENLDKIKKHLAPLIAARDKLWRSSFKLDLPFVDPVSFVVTALQHTRGAMRLYAAQQLERLADGIREGFIPEFKLKPTARVELICDSSGKRWVSTHESDRAAVSDTFLADEPIVLEPSNYPTGCFIIVMEPAKPVHEGGSLLFQEPV